MISKAKIIGADNVQKKLRWLEKQSRRHNNVGVIVGYTAAYALWVHENMEIWPPGMRLKGQKRRGKKHKGRYWDPQGRAQPKFLEHPFRDMRDELVAIAYKMSKNRMAHGKGIDQGLYVAGLALQRVSQQLVPVEFGTLKASAFTRLVHDNKGRG